MPLFSIRMAVFTNYFVKETYSCEEERVESHICEVTASAAQAAVSARRMNGPSEAAAHCADTNAARSLSVQPPSGPIATAVP